MHETLTKSFCHMGKIINNPYISYSKDFVIYNTENYIRIYEFINDILYPVMNTFFKSYGEIKHIAHFSVRDHFHEFSPKKPYLSVTYRVHDKNDHTIFKLKFSPYVSSETNKFELNLGITLLDPQYMMILNTIKKHLYLLKGYQCVNLSDNNIFLYAILNKIIPSGLDLNRTNFKKDICSLHQYAETLNVLVPINLKFNEEGIIESRNKNIKLMYLKDICKFPIITSYILHHS